MQTPSSDVGLELSSVLAQIRQSTSLMPPPKLVILDQQSLAQEAFTADGQQKNLHIVVKNTPFIITVGLTGSIMGNRIVDFSTLTLETTLLFDSEDHREVPYMKQKPVEYKGKVNDKADQMTLDIKISVLSSHCENMCFRLKFQAVDARGGRPISELTVLSDPIKVISKPDQITKKGQTPAARKRKRTANDAIMEALARIEDYQKQHHRLMEQMREESRAEREQLLQNLQHQPHQTSTSTSSSSSSQQQPPFCVSPALPLDVPPNLFGNLLQTEFGAEALGDPNQSVTETHLLPIPALPPNAMMHHLSSSTSTSCSSTTTTTLQLNAFNPHDPSALETAYNALLDAYSKLPANERPEKIRKIVRNSSTRKTETFCEMIALFNAEGLQKETGRDLSLGIGVGGSCSTGDQTEVGCSGPTICPHQLRLAEIDKFYSELLNI
jgi:hypothetical protein